MGDLYFCPSFDKNISLSYNYENYFCCDDFDNFGEVNESVYYYFTTDPINENDNSTSSENSLPPLKDNIKLNNDIPQNEEQYNSQKPLFGLRKRKRPGKIKIFDEEERPYVHTKNKCDNILTKLQVSYVNFLVYLVNIILEAYGRKDLKFYLIDSAIKKNNKIENRQKLKEGTIADILKNNISKKYSTLSQESNFCTYDELEKEGLKDILNVLNQKFLFFFEDIYFKNLRKFNLNQFGLMNLDIEIPAKIELYENLLMKNKADPTFENYKVKMEKCAKRHFLGGLEEEYSKLDVKLND